jgi:hypothetical protein
VEAELVEITPTPTLKEIAPYTRSLAENVYAVKKVLQGDIKEKRIVVAQWVILDEKILRRAPHAAKSARWCGWSWNPSSATRKCKASTRRRGTRSSMRRSLRRSFTPSLAGLALRA